MISNTLLTNVMSTYTIHVLQFLFEFKEPKKVYVEFENILKYTFFLIRPYASFEVLRTLLFCCFQMKVENISLV